MYYSISNKVANSIPHSYASSLDGFEVDFVYNQDYVYSGKHGRF